MLAPKARNSEALRQHRIWQAARERMSPRPRLVVSNAVVEAAPISIRQASGLEGWVGSSGPGHIRIPWFGRGTMRTVLAEVSREYQIHADELKSESRRMVVTLPRQIAMWRMSVEQYRNASEIGRFLNRDHSTVLHAIKKIDALVNSGQLTLPEGWGRAG